MPFNKKNLILLTLNLLVSCSPSPQDSTLISHWKKKTPKISFERKLASDSKQKCFSDTYTVETLKKEIQLIEEQYADLPPVQGLWNEIDLSFLPVPQANFLKKYGDQIGDRREGGIVNYGDCRNVPCIINKIYGKENSQNGYVHYLWYLKLGHLLSADNWVPSQMSKVAGEYQVEVEANPATGQERVFKKHTLDEYMWYDRELYGFWRLSHMLEVPHTNLHYLKEIQRIPHKGWMENNIPSHCGIASRAGFIHLTDGCTVFDKNQDQGFFYASAIHEMSHQVDYQMGYEQKLPGLIFSNSAEYLTISGFDRIEFKDDKQKTKISYQVKPGTKMVRSYAGTSPQESFADSMGYFRQDGDFTKPRLSPEFYQFLGDRFYHQKSFDRPSLFKRWLEKYQVAMIEKSLKAAVDCDNVVPSTDNSGDSGIFTPEDFDNAIPVEKLSCLSRAADDVMTTIERSVRELDPDGCNALSPPDKKTIWNDQLKATVRDNFKRGLAGIKEESDYATHFKTLLTQINEPRARDLYIGCTQESVPQSCFTQKMSEMIEFEGKKEGFTEQKLKDLKEILLNVYTFSYIQEESLKFYYTLLDSNSGLTQSKAQNLWQQCKSHEADDDRSPEGRLFTLNHGYMISSMYNCINSTFPQVVNDILGSLSFDGTQVTSTDERFILKKELNIRLNDELRKIFEIESPEEEKILTSIDPKSISQKMFSDLSWVVGTQLYQSCRTHALSLMPNSLYFHERRELFSKIIEGEICFKFSSTPEVKSYLNSNREKFQEEVNHLLEIFILTKVEPLEADCHKQFPKGNIIQEVTRSLKRKTCIKNGWDTLEESAVYLLSMNDLAVNLGISYDDLMTRAKKFRHQYRREADENFKNH